MEITNDIMRATILIIFVLALPKIGWSQLQDTKKGVIDALEIVDQDIYLHDNDIHVDKLKLRILDTDDDSVKILYLSKLAYYSVYSDVKQSAKYGEEALRKADSLDSDFLRIYALLYRGNALTVQSLYLQSLAFYKHAYEIESKNNFSKFKGAIINNIGDSYMELNDYESAYKYFQESLKLSQNTKDSLLEAISMFNIGRVYKVQANYTKALDYINNSKVLSKKIHDMGGVAYSDYELGLISHLQGETSQAVAFLESSITVSDSIGIDELTAQSLVEIANIKVEQDELLSALQYYHKALDINEKINNLKGIAEVNLGLGTLQIKMNSLLSASNSLLHGLSISLVLQDKELESRFYEVLSLFYERKGNYSKSLEYYKLYKTNADSVFNRETNMQVALMEMQFDSEKKDKEIALLKEVKASAVAEMQKQKTEYTLLYGGFMFVLVISIVLVINVRSKKKKNNLLREQKKEIETKNRQLDKLNNVKDKFFSIISHDLKSPFQSLSGLLELMSMDALSDKELKNLFKELKIKFDGTNDLLENLLNWAKIQMKETKHDSTIIGLKDAVNEELQVIQGYKRKSIKIENKVESLSKVVADFNMLKLVIRNLVNNAVKFTNQKGKIEIISEEIGDFVHVSVKDNGVGISKENLPKIFNIETTYTTPGTELEKGTGLGLLLCREFIEMHGGKIWVESEEGKGSTFKFTLKKAS